MARAAIRRGNVKIKTNAQRIENVFRRVPLIGFPCFFISGHQRPQKKAPRRSGRQVGRA